MLGSTVTIELSEDLAGVSPIWRGRIVPLGQVGSLVRIPQGQVSLLASVTQVGLSEAAPAAVPTVLPAQGDRWLQAQLLGEVDGLGEFHRGISSYPSLDDTVHFTTPEVLSAVYPPSNECRVGIGVLATSPDTPVSLDAARLVTRHSAVVGSTGSGKTSAVVSLLQSLCAEGWAAANVVIVDPHGEYSAAFGDDASVRSVLGAGSSALRVPFWALPSDDILGLLCSVDGKTVRDKFAELVFEARRSFAAEAGWLDLDPAAITADTPIPFDLRWVWHALDYANRSVVSSMQGGTVLEVDAGNPATLQPAEFEPYGAGGAAPFKGPTFRHYTPAPERLRTRLQDRSLSFLLESVDPSKPDPLIETVQGWLGGERPISILDFSGVAADITDATVGLVLELLFEIATRGNPSDGVGRHRPILIVLEEAHRYLAAAASTRLASAATNRIAREGRKYGVGLMMVTQRPSELPDTALAQCGTILALRLTNGADQATVRNGLPDSVSGLADALPALRTGEALVAGESVVLPSRVLMRRPNPEPLAADASLDGWRGAARENDLSGSIGRWRSSRAGGSA